MHVMLELAVRSKLHSTHDSNHGGGVSAETLGHSTYTEKDKFSRPFESRANDGLPFRAQEANASGWAHHRNRTRDFPLPSHWAQKHVGKRCSVQLWRGLRSDICFCFVLAR